MKKYIIIFILIFIIFLSCSVNDATGNIRVLNKTSINLRNLRVGSTLIVSYLASGYYYDYWFYNNIEGKITSEEIPVSESIEDITYVLRPGYWITIIAGYDDSGEEEVTISFVRQGSRDVDWDDIVKD